MALALVADLFSGERGEKMGWYSSAMLVGRSAAPWVGGAILGVFAVGAVGGDFGYRVVYAVCGVAGVLALLLALRLPVQPSAAGAGPEAAPGQGWQNVKEGLREVLSHRGILFTSATETAQYFAYGAWRPSCRSTPFASA